MSEKKSIVKKVIDDMKESARKQHEIDKENFEAVKRDSKADLKRLQNLIQTLKNLKKQKV